MTTKPAIVKLNASLITNGIQSLKSVSVNHTTVQSHTILKNLNVSASATPILRRGAKKISCMMNMKPVDVCAKRPVLHPTY